jgi:hypothetical protein
LSLWESKLLGNHKCARLRDIRSDSTRLWPDVYSRRAVAQCVSAHACWVDRRLDRCFCHGPNDRLRRKHGARKLRACNVLVPPANARAAPRSDVRPALLNFRHWARPTDWYERPLGLGSEQLPIAVSEQLACVVCVHRGCCRYVARVCC